VVNVAVQSEWVAKARAVAPLVREYRDACERERRMVRPLHEGLRDAGFFRLMLPRQFGGEQLDLITGMRVIEELSRQDGSVGWNVMIGTHWSLFADYFPEEAARALFTPDATFGGSVAPLGRAVPEPGGYRITGTWPFGSGCQNATWIGVGCVTVADGESGSAAEPPEARIYFVPASMCEIRDTWMTAGMRGTGSHDIRVHEIFVPAERTLLRNALFQGPTSGPGAAYPQPLLPHVAAPTLAAVALGVARDAIDSFVAIAATTVQALGSTPLAEHHTVHDRVGRAEGLLRSGRAFLYEAAQEVMTAIDDGADLDAVAAVARLAGAQAVQSAAMAADLMFDAGGGSAIYTSSRLERCFRDVHVVSHHHMASPTHFEMVGQYFLGRGLQFRR
jgi:indole-3-acetate monooxygenase